MNKILSVVAMAAVGLSCLAFAQSGKMAPKKSMMHPKMAKKMSGKKMAGKKMMMKKHMKMSGKKMSGKKMMMKKGH